MSCILLFLVQFLNLCFLCVLLFYLCFLFVWMVAERIGRGEELNLKFLTLFLLQVIYIVGQKRGEEEWLPDPVAASDVGWSRQLDCGGRSGKGTESGLREAIL